MSNRYICALSRLSSRCREVCQRRLFFRLWSYLSSWSKIHASTVISLCRELKVCLQERAQRQATRRNILNHAHKLRSTHASCAPRWFAMCFALSYCWLARHHNDYWSGGQLCHCRSTRRFTRVHGFVVRLWTRSWITTAAGGFNPSQRFSQRRDAPATSNWR